MNPIVFLVCKYKTNARIDASIFINTRHWIVLFMLLWTEIVSFGPRNECPQMIQRIQSLFLLLVALCLGALFFTDLAQIQDVLLTINGHEAADTVIDKQLESFLPFPLAALVIGAILLTVLVLFSYKDRKRQMLLGRINYLLILTLVVLIFLSISDLQKQLADTNTNPYKFGTYLPIISLGFHLLANRAIKRDEELVKSLDRLR